MITKQSLLKFGAQWCAPCHKLDTILIQLHQDLPNLAIENIDVDDKPDLARLYKIKTLPTLIMLQNQIEVDRLTGLTSIEEIKKRL